MPEECERFDAGPGVSLYVHQQVFDETKEPLSISFVFGLMGRCRAILSP